AVFRPAGLPVLDARAVERSADDVIPDAREVAHAAAADEDDRVLLQVVPFAGDVGRGLASAREPHARDLPQRGVRLLGRHRLHDEADAPLLGIALQNRRLGLVLDLPAPLAYELIDGRHRPPIIETAIPKSKESW